MTIANDSFVFIQNVFKSMFYSRNRSALKVNCNIIIHCLEVSCKEDQITSAQRERFIVVQLTDVFVGRRHTVQTHDQDLHCLLMNVLSKF